MRRKVNVEISSTRYMDGTEERIVEKAEGVFDKAQGVLMYKSTDNGDVTATILHINKDIIAIRKMGAVTAEMIFEKGKVTSGKYKTPFGEHDISIDTRETRHVSAEKEENIYLKYSLVLGGENLGETTLSIKAVYL